MSGEQGYAQGRLIVDIGSFLFGLGELKGIMNSWKRLRKIDLRPILEKCRQTTTNTLQSGKKYIGNTASTVKKEIKNLSPFPTPDEKVEKKITKLRQAAQKGDLLKINISGTEKKILGEEKEIRDLIATVKDHAIYSRGLETSKKTGSVQYSGGHTKSALENLTRKNNGVKYELKEFKLNSETGVYECRPEITLSDGTIVRKVGNKGICTFFPDTWDEAKILKEVNFASQHLIGKYTKIRNGYVGISSDGKVKIVIQFDEYINKKGVKVKNITSYYPLFE